MVYQWLISNHSRWLPQACLLCGQTSHSQSLCTDCQRDLPRFTNSCPQCGLPLPHLTSPAMCGHCLQQPPHYDRVISSFAYAPPVSQLVSKLKFQGEILQARLLGEFLLETVQSADSQAQAILPVPLHKRRLRQRGFNQALEISRPLSKGLGIPLLLQSIDRLRDTLPQSEQNASQRAANVRGTFRLKQPLDYRHIAIVDDVMTSGHTVNEIARQLRASGVEQIEVWCVARAWPHNTAGLTR